MTKMLSYCCRRFILSVIKVCPRSRPGLNTIKTIHGGTSLQLSLYQTFATEYATLGTHNCLRSPLSSSVPTIDCSYKPGFLSVKRHASTSHDEDEPWYNVHTDELVAMMQRNEEDFLLVDVREPEELRQTGVIPGSINMPMEEVEEAFSMSPDDFDISYGEEKPPMDSPNIVFTCLSGIRSLVAMSIVHQLGYSRARHYKNGWLGWEQHLNEEKNSDINTNNDNNCT